MNLACRLMNRHSHPCLRVADPPQYGVRKEVRNPRSQGPPGVNALRGGELEAVLGATTGCTTPSRSVERPLCRATAEGGGGKSEADGS